MYSDALAAGLEKSPGRRIERPNASLQIDRRFAPIQARFFTVYFARIGDALLRLRPRGYSASADTIERGEHQPSPEHRQSGGELGGGRVATDGYCFLRQDRASVEPFIHLHD